MKRKKKKPKARVRKPAKKAKKRVIEPGSVRTTLKLHSKIERLESHVEKLWDIVDQNDERVQDAEIHINLLTRLITMLCVEKFGMRVGVLKRLIKRIEKEAIRDSQIDHLESLYNLPLRPNKKRGKAPQKPSDPEPWDDLT